MTLLWNGNDGYDWCITWKAFNIPSTGYKDFGGSYPCTNDNIMNPYITHNTSNVRIGTNSIKITLNDGTYARSMIVGNTPIMYNQSEEWGE